MPRQILLALALLLLFRITSAGRFPRMDAFGWPADAEDILRSQDYKRLLKPYREEKADEFLANAMLHLTQIVPDAKAFGSREKYILAPTFLPRHRLSTKTRGRPTYSPSRSAYWFSLPLLVDDVHNPGSLVHFREQHQDGTSARLLDIIRFDRFKGGFGENFWLPTGIVRPTFRDRRKTVDLSLIYEFPTSPAKFRENFRRHPEQALSSLKEALSRKQDVWLAKVTGQDRRSISEMWQRAVHSPWLRGAGPFGPVSNSNLQRASPSGLHASSSSHPLTIEANPDSDEHVYPNSLSDLDGVPTSMDQARIARHQVPAPGHGSPDVSLHGVPNSRQYTRLPTLDTSHVPPEGPLGPSHSFTRPDVDEIPGLSREPGAHNSDNTESPQRKQFHSFIADHSADGGSVLNAHEAAGHNLPDLASSSSGVVQVPQPGPSLAEHDFFHEQPNFSRIRPLRPKALYPWQQQPSQLPHQVQVTADPTPPYLHSLRQEKNVDLELSLAPSQPKFQWRH